VRKIIDELNTKWSSSSCFLKYYGDRLGLTALKPIDKDELVAKYSDPMTINEQTHYILNSNEPNLCLGEDGKVYAKHDIHAHTQLTLDFNTVTNGFKND
jgi:hypothetical protein